MEDAQSKDLDETRRLLYMALAAPRTAKYNLVGTLTNALAHHGLGIDPGQALEQVIGAVEDGRSDWIMARIEDVTARLQGEQVSPGTSASL